MAATNEVPLFMKSFISQNSSESLEIPFFFNEYLADPLPNNVELLGQGKRSWTIRLEKRGETMFLTLGWETFVRENNLEDGKRLTFCYDGDRSFMVVVYGHGGCNEFRDLPQVAIDVDDYATCEEEEEEKEED
ncbi:unnamed protein product [Microthlaspi erraticum]|uniref:TF-B3 domain-containing protein n=1 Tax=Microthlaspi erraticum TaxID=1685480 RepID=A0A6D2KX15_9BRAS|nr:unnamed protein product [Microthlaspi erraticum]